MVFLVTATYAALFVAIFDWASIGFKGYQFYIRCGLGVAMSIFGLGRFLIALPIEEYIMIAGSQFSHSSVTYGLMELSVGIGLVVSRRHQRVVQLLYIGIIATLFTSNTSIVLGNWLGCPIYKASCDVSQFSQWDTVVQTAIVFILLVATVPNPLQRIRQRTFNENQVALRKSIRTLVLPYFTALT